MTLSRAAFAAAADELRAAGVPVIAINSGYPDDLKFRSSMTLFAHAAADNQIFLDALAKYFNGEFDPLTLERL